MRPDARGHLALLVLCALGASLAAECGSTVRIDNFDAQTRYVEISQSGYALMVGCSNPGSEFRWEFLQPDRVTPLDVAFYDVGASTNADGLTVDEKFTGTSRPHQCWQPVDLAAAGTIDFRTPGPPPHGFVRLTVDGSASVIHPFRIGTLVTQQIGVISSTGYLFFMDEPYLRWFRGEEVVGDLLQQRAIDPTTQVWSVGFNLPEQSWAGNNEFFFKPLSDGRNLQDAVEEAFNAVDDYNATASAGEEIPRGWFGIDFGRIDLARKRDPSQCCIDDGTGHCDRDRSLLSPTRDFLGCGGPYGSAGGAEEWCVIAGTSTCHEADGSYGGLEGWPGPDGEMGKPDSLTVDRLLYVDQAAVSHQDQLFGMFGSPCEVTDFTDYDAEWFCSAYDTRRCLHGPSAGDLCSSDAQCRVGVCGRAVPLWYGSVSDYEGQPWGNPRRCKNPWGYCWDDPTKSCNSREDCGGSLCIVGQEQGNCTRTARGIGIWDRRDRATREHLIGMTLHTLEEAWNLRPGTNRDHFTVTFGGEGLHYYDRGDSCRGDRAGCDQLDHSFNTFAHKDDQFSYPGLSDQRVHYRNPTKAGEWEFADSKFYADFADALKSRGFSNEAFLIFHSSKYRQPIEALNVSNRLWWMTEPAREKLRNDGRGNLLQTVTLDVPSGLNGRAPEPRADSMAYAFRSDQLIRLAARHSSIDDGRPTVGTDSTTGALWSYWTIDPADDPALNCPDARFGGTGASPKTEPVAFCTTQSPDCVVGPDGLCPESARATCTIDPSDPAWGSCRNLVVSVFDYDHRTSGLCSEGLSSEVKGEVGKRCQSDQQCDESCEPRPSVGADNIQHSVALVELDASALAAKGGLVEMDFGDPGCTHSDGVNRATYVADSALALCDAGDGMRDIGGLAHVEVLDQASPAIDDDVVVLEGRFRKVGGTHTGSASGVKLGFGYVSGQGWGSDPRLEADSRRVRSAATRNAPLLWFDGLGVSLRCPDTLSGSIDIADQGPHDFRITWDRIEGSASLEMDGERRSCAIPQTQGAIGGFVILPADSSAEGGPAFPFDILWDHVSLSGNSS